MRASKDFEIFSQQFYSHIIDDAADIEELISFAMGALKDAGSRARLREYLEEITNDSISGEALRELWWSSPADTIFHDGEELRMFLRMVRDRL